MSKGAPDQDHLLDAVALLVLDVQERLLPAMADPEPFVDRVAFAIEAARSFNLKIIFTEQMPEKLGPTLPRLKKLAPNARVFRKSSFSALQANGLQDYMRGLNVYHLLVCGLETNICIYQTALQAADLELDTTLLSDCLASRRPEDDAFVLPALSRNGCHILPSEAVFYSMVADATNSRFRALSDLVKHYDALRRGETPPERRVEQAPAKEVQPPQRDHRNNEQPSATGEESKAIHRDESGTPSSEKPKAKRSRGRKQKAPAASETAPRATAADAGEPKTTAKAPEKRSPAVAEHSGDEPKKPRRRRRGPRKPKPSDQGDSTVNHRSPKESSAKPNRGEES